MNGNITTAPLGGNRNIKTKPLFQYDYGQVLKIIGVTLPAAYEVHFSNQLHGVATTQIGNADGVIIPDIYLTTGEPVYAWIYLHTGNSDGETEYTITIPVVRRASISDAEPTPVQQDVITQAIAALNTAVEQTAQDVQDATEAKQDAEEAAGNAYESAVAAAQSAANAGTYAGQAQTAQAASELAQQKAEEAQLDAQAAQWAAESAQTAAEAAQAGAVAARTGAETAQAWAVAARSGAETAQHAAEAARDEITGLSATANTLPAGAQATASYSDGLLTIGVPKGEKGDHGDTGATPDLTIGTVQTLPAGSSATASITGTAEDPVLNLGIPKGDAGEVTQAEFDVLSDTVDDMQDTLEHKADIDGYYTDMTVGAAEQVVSSTMVEDNAPYKFRTSGGSTDIGNRAYVDKIVGGTVAWNQQVRDAASENVTEYADLVTVTDAVEDDAAVSVRVEPAQDLHGYDAPWPAGGGKNICYIEDFTATINGLPISAVNNVLTLNGTNNSSISANASEWKHIKFTVKTAGRYAISFYPSLPTGLGYYVYDSSMNTVPLYSDVPVGDYTVGLYIPGNTTLNISIQIQMESGSSATSFAPYSNICPISGWDEVNVTRTGKNLLSYPYYFTTQTSNECTATVADDGSVTFSGAPTNDTTWNIKLRTTTTGNGSMFLQAGTYILNGCPAGGSATTYQISVIAQDGSTLGIDRGSGVSITIPSGGMYIGVQLFVHTGYDPSVLKMYPMIRLSSVSDDTYTPYVAPSQSTITLPQTVYSGTVGSEGGESRSSFRTFAELGADTRWNRLSSGTFAFYLIRGHSLPNCSYPLPEPPKSTHYKYSVTGTMENGTFRVSDALYIVDDRFETIGEFRAWLSSTDGGFWYRSEPTEFAITTPPQITTLLGTNHVWSDAGQLSLTYTGTDEYLTLTSGRKYLTRINGTDSMVLGAGQEVTAVKGRDNVFDLTQMFGTAVADYVYQQGTSYFRKWFGGTRYAYNAGELISVQGLQSRDVTGFNAWDEEWEVGGISASTGQNVSDNTRIRSKNYIRVMPSTAYYYGGYAIGEIRPVYYGADKSLVGLGNWAGYSSNRLQTTPSNCCYMRIVSSPQYGTTYNHDICINISNSGTRNGEYQPYEKRSYPLDSTLTLRGIPNVGSNGVYWDGDEYGYDGGVKRRYGEFIIDGNAVSSFATSSAGIKYVSGNISPSGKDGKTNKITTSNYSISSSGTVDKSVRILGGAFYVYNNEFESLDDAKSKLNASPIWIVYELDTSTTETAQPYQHIQHVDDWGTEEFVSATITPVGHQTRFPQNLRDKLQHLPALASANGSYIITQTDGQMVLSPFPTPPTAAGNYLLKATVSGGNATYSWVAQ